MGKSSPSAPTPPDPAQTAAAQAAANKEAVRESALMNQITQVTPWGSLSYTGELGSPDRTVTQTLAPAQQQMLEQNNQAGLQYGEIANNQLGAVAERFSSPVEFAGAPPTADPEAWQRSYDAIINRNQPQASRQREMLETRLANQGIDIGSAAYGSAMDDYNRGQNDFSLAAQNAALGQQATAYGMDASAYDQAIRSQLMERQAPLNELAALMSGTQVQAPPQIATGQYMMNPADIMGATYGSYNGQMNAYNANQANDASNMQGLAGLLGAGAQAYAYNPLAWSDRRLKADIVRIGTFANLPLYVWRYIWGAPGVGFMADEVREVKPWAVHRIGDFDAVNYAEAIR